MKIITHRVGNKINGEEMLLSNQELHLTQEMAELIQNYFLGALKSEETYNFYSDSYLSNNEVYTSVSEIFDNPDSFIFESENIAKVLYDAAENPRIQGGELFIILFEGENQENTQIGIFKTEKRENILKFTYSEDNIEIEADQGVSLGKVDQVNYLTASLAYFMEKEQFEFREFTNEVLIDESVIQSFSDFKTDYEQNFQMNIAEEFEINTAAVKKVKRHFKSVIKLDKNFQIHIHGDKKLLEQGEDEKGKFYQLYFQKEQ